MDRGKGALWERRRAANYCELIDRERHFAVSTAVYRLRASEIFFNSLHSAIF
jgi:hypothetical protein